MARVSFWEGIFAFCACLAWPLCASNAAAAAPVPLELDWRAPEAECPTQAALLQQVAALVERHPTSAYPVRAVALVERLGSERYRVRLTTESQGTLGTRVLEERSCAALGDV